MGGILDYYHIPDITIPRRIACIKCPMHIGVELARIIRARDGIMDLLQEVPDLSDEERAVAEGDRNTLNRLIEKYKDVSPPPVPNERYIFNPVALASPLRKPLPVITMPEMKSLVSLPSSPKGIVK